MESFNTQNNVDLNFGANPEWSLISNNMNSVSLDSKYERVENISSPKEESSAREVEGWPHHSVPSLKSLHVESKPDTVPILASERVSLF